MMYDNFYNQGRFFGSVGSEGFFGPSALFGGLFLLIVLVSLVLKGFALWHSAKRGEKWWFIAILIINTMGLLELAYLIFFAKVWGKGCCKGKNMVKVCDHKDCDCGDCEKCKKTDN